MRESIGYLLLGDQKAISAALLRIRAYIHRQMAPFVDRTFAKAWPASVIPQNTVENTSDQLFCTQLVERESTPCADQSLVP